MIKTPPSGGPSDRPRSPPPPGGSEITTKAWRANAAVTIAAAISKSKDANRWSPEDIADRATAIVDQILKTSHPVARP